MNNSELIERAAKLLTDDGVEPRILVAFESQARMVCDFYRVQYNPDHLGMIRAPDFYIVIDGYQASH